MYICKYIRVNLENTCCAPSLSLSLSLSLPLFPPTLHKHMADLAECDVVHAYGRACKHKVDDSQICDTACTLCWAPVMGRQQCSPETWTK